MKLSNTTWTSFDGGRVKLSVLHRVGNRQETCREVQASIGEAGPLSCDGIGDLM